ncbi:MAG: DUF5704 domain-containing protein [Lachnospiraceae bacterium]
MKKCIFLVKLCVLISAALLIIPHEETAYAEEGLYFDDSGNLVFATYNKAATGKIRYRTVGWVIKKYEEAINENGQISGIIPLPEFYYRVEDKNNPGYVYIYFIINKEQVLKVIEKVSPKWRQYLEKYGDTVYLDSVMTVDEYGVLQGGLNGNGSDWGEIYYDFQGISGARGWADPSCLKEYFNIPVVFPADNNPKPSVEYKEPQQQYVDYEGSVITSTTIGSHTINDHEYDISRGIPSGEDLYVYGMADAYCCEGRLVKHSGKIKVPVKVVTDYELKWTDTKGRSKSELRRVEQWCTVEKSYLYYAIDYFDVYNLEIMEVSGDATGNITENDDSDRYSAEIINYGSVKNHIAVGEGYYYRGKVIICSSNHLKPDIEEINENQVKEGGNAYIKVRNDRLKVGNTILLNDEWDSGAYIGQYNNNPVKKFYITGILIPKDMRNGSVANERAVYVYRCGNKIKKVSNSLEHIKIHTPVVCNGAITAPKKYNMSVNPQADQLVLGCDFGIKMDTYGSHREIKGYGCRDYGNYVSKRKVRFPFSVIINKVTYKAGSWIDIEQGIVICRLPQYVKTGKYKVDFSVDASNAPDINISYGNKANFDISQYGAVSTIEVDVIGTIYGFSGVSEENTSYVGKNIGFMGRVPEGSGIMPITMKPENTYTLSIYSNGFGANSDDRIEAEITYYYIKDGQRHEVDVYIEESRDILSRRKLKKVPEAVEWTNEEKEMHDDNIFLWKKEFFIGGNIIALPKGTDISDTDKVWEYIFRNGNILINFDIKGYCGENAENSYINVENYREGYCNMWKSEGYSYEFVDNMGEKINLKDGDAFVTALPGKLYEDYEIVGTH